MSMPSLARFLTGLFLFSVPLSAAPSNPPDVRATSITIPYAEVRALWEAAYGKPAPKPPPPISHSLSLARYAFELSPDLSSVECRATFEVTSYGDGWSIVPLLPAEVRIESVTPEAGALAVRDGFYTLFLNGPGKRSVNVRFVARLASAPGGAPGLRLAVPPALVAEASFSGVPAGSLVEIANALPVGGAGVTPATYRLGANPIFDFTVTSAGGRAKKAPATWNAGVQTIVAAEEGRVVCRSRLVLSGLDGDTSELKLSLPDAASIREVESDNLERWESTRRGEGGQCGVSVRWKGAERVGREVNLLYELPLNAREGEWTLSGPRVEGAVQQQSIFYVIARAGLEVTPVGGSDGESARSVEAPGPAMLVALGGAGFKAISAPPGEASTIVKVRRLPLVAIAQARIDDAQFHMRVVPDGSCLTDAKMAVRHDRPLALQVELPPGSELVACSINGTETSPIDRGNGVLEFALPAAGAGEPSRIAFSYAAHASKLAPVAGQVELTLPRTELFTNSIAWEVQLPGAYELTAFEGNVELAPPSRGTIDPSTTFVRLRKELCKGEAPRVSLFYQKRSVNP